MNYERLNTFVDRYEEKMDQESNTTNDERLQKSLAENANDYIRRSEIGSGLLQGASVVYHSKDYIDKAKDTFETIKRLPKDLEEKVNKLRQQAEEGIDAAKDGVARVQDGVARVRGGVQDGVARVQDGVARVRGGVQDGVARVQDGVQDGVARVQDGVQDGVARVRDGVDNAREDLTQTVKDNVDRVRDGVDNAREDLTQTVQDNVGRVNAPEAPEAPESTDFDGDALPDTDWRSWDVSKYDDIQDSVQEGVDRVQSRPVVDWTTGTMREEQEENQPRRTVQQEQFDETKIKPRPGLANEDSSGEIPSYFRVTEPPETPMEAKIRRLRGRPDQTNTEQLNQEINTSNEAENTSKSLAKTGSKLAAEEEGIAGVGADVEAESGGLVSELVVPLVSVAMVGTAIADLFHNKPKKTKIQAPNPLFVPKNFTLDKQALVSSSQLPR